MNVSCANCYRLRTRKGTVLTGVLSVHILRGGGYPIWLTGRGIPPSQVRMGVSHPSILPDRVGTPFPGQDGGVPNPRSGQGDDPIPGQDGTPIRNGWGTPCQDWMEYPPSGLDGGTPHQDWMGYPPHQGIGRQSSYAAGGMPLAFTQKDFLVIDSLPTIALALV